MPFPSRRTSPGRLAGAVVAVAAACAATLPALASLAPAQAAVRAPAVTAPAVTAPAVTAPAVTAPAVTAPAVTAKAGLTGPKITVANNAEFSGYDMATGPNGTAYIGWIGDTGSGRKVSLCTLPRGATRCAGGVQTIASAPDATFSSTAAGLRVLVSKSNLVTLVWMHSTVNSENGPEGDEIAIATSQAGGPLSALQDVSAGPSFGNFLDATLAPDGSIWTAVNPAGAAHTIQITRGLGTGYKTITAPYYPGAAVIAFSGGSAVLAVDKYGAITQPVSFARQSGAGWTAFKSIARTWNVSGFGLAETTSGIRLIATENNADYHPVVSRLTNAGWSTPVLTGDLSNCSPNSHDVVSDASGRLADASAECDDSIAIANLANTRHAAIVRFPVSGTMAGGSPQLTTAPSGRGWVAWSVESANGDKLIVAPVLLPGLDVTSAWSGRGGRVVVTGPASCLPPVDVPVGLAAKAAGGWQVTSRSLKLGGSAVGSVLHGAGLAPGTFYTLTGTATFASGGSRSTGRTSVGFRTCPRP
jgi:hypothetical protein